VHHPDGRVVLFQVPARPIGMPIQYEGAYWMRGGQALVPMTPDRLKTIFDEAGPDFSAEICPRASLADLHPAAIEEFRARWRQRSGNPAIDHLPVEQLLADAELVVDGGVTYAALVLFGTRQALGKCLPQAEVIFEYRSSDASGPAQQREEYRQGFFLFQDNLWTTINLRNDRQHFQSGLFVLDIPTFNERAIREAVLNAVSHRDYRLAGSVFVRQYPRRLELVSPGGFPAGVTQDNILWRQAPRNRRIAEACAKCGLVERSGQGINLMFEESIREGKSTPDFTGTDAYQVFVTLRGEIHDPQFLRFLEQIGSEQLAWFTTHDFLVLDLVHRDQRIPEALRAYLPALEEQGIIERIGRRRYMLSRRFYGFLGKKGVYTRRRGLDRETNKTLLLKHIQDSQHEGSKLQELMQVLPALSRDQVQKLLQALKVEGRIYHVGYANAARWYPSPDLSGIAPKSETY
jgi:ATP-dependent DNA helicase RecG